MSSNQAGLEFEISQCCSILLPILNPVLLRVFNDSISSYPHPHEEGCVSAHHAKNSKAGKKTQKVRRDAIKLQRKSRDISATADGKCSPLQ